MPDAYADRISAALEHERTYGRTNEEPSYSPQHPSAPYRARAYCPLPYNNPVHLESA